MKRLIPIVSLGLLATGCASSTPVATSSYNPPSTYVQAQPSATVRDAQQRLSALGYYAGPIDGLWGPDTQAAVERFQRDRGLQVTGDLNQVTASALQGPPQSSFNAAPQPSAALRDTQQRLRAFLAVTGDLNAVTASALRSAPPLASRGAISPAEAQATDPTSVRTVQNRLRQLGYFNAPADGVWGPSTQVALENFQRAQGLDMSGQLTPSTVAALGFEPGSFPPRSTATAAAQLDPAVVQSAQRELRRLGFYRGPADGVWGPRSQEAGVRSQQPCRRHRSAALFGERAALTSCSAGSLAAKPGGGRRYDRAISSC